MKRDISPADETARLEALENLDILDTLPEQAYDDITFLASQLCDTPISLVSFVDRDRQWFKSRVGLEATETDRELAFCAHAILEPEDLMIVPDAQQDSRFADNPLVTRDPSIRFYAGAPLLTPEGHALGTLCVIDTEPRQLTATQSQSLRALSRQVMAQLDLRRSVAELNQSAAAQHHYEQQLKENQRVLEQNVATISHLSLTDPLTGLHNRRALKEKLEEEFAKSARYNTDLSFALLDVDDFKPYNDSKGHLAGDDLLELMARVVKSQTRASDFVARYGGDEFAIVFTNTRLEGAHLLAERIRVAIDRDTPPGSKVTISVGVATASPAIATPNLLIDAADKALYRAKRAGRNQVALATSPRSAGG